MTTDNLTNIYLALSVVCGFINIPPTLLHLCQGHSGPAAFGLWAVTLNLLAFVNGVIWRHDAINRAPVFCDLSSHITQVGPLGLLIANCCIIRYLAGIVTPGQMVEDRREKRQRILCDFFLSFGFPVILAGLSIIYQVARYQINRLAGCSSVSALVWPTFLLSVIWPPIWCGISCGYSFYVLYWLLHRHREIKLLVKASRTPLNISRFARMAALSMTYFCISAPCAVYGTLEIIAATGPYVPWVAWSTVHNEDNNLSIVRQYPLYQYQLRDWLPIAAGLVVLVFFSFGVESQAFYCQVKELSIGRFETCYRALKWERPKGRKKLLVHQVHELQETFTESTSSTNNRPTKIHGVAGLGLPMDFSSDVISSSLTTGSSGVTASIVQHAVDV